MSIDNWSALVSISAGVTSQPDNPSNQSFGGNAPTQNPGTTGTAPAPAGTGTGPAAPAPGLGPIVWLLPLFLVFLFFTTWRQNKAEKRKQQQLSDSIGKGDEVRMVGGEIGRIYDVRDNEIVLEFEQGRARYVKSSVVAILKSKKSASASIETKSEQKEPAGA